MQRKGVKSIPMKFRLEIEQEEDGRWIAEIPDLPGVLAYGNTPEEAQAKVQALALRVVADRLEHGEAGADLVSMLSQPHEPMVRTRGRRVLAALLRIGWVVKRQSGSHRTLSRPGWPDFVFAFHDNEEIGPRMLARISKRTGLSPENL